MFIRTASRRDLEAVRALLVEAWHAAFDDVHGVERVTEIARRLHSLDALEADLERPQSEFLVADDGKSLGGMAYAAAGGDGKTVTVHHLSVRPAFQRSGTGSALLAEVAASFPGAEMLDIHVIEQDVKTLAFCRASGFAVARVAENRIAHASGLSAVKAEKRIG